LIYRRLAYPLRGRTKSDTLIRCRACGRFLAASYLEHGIHFCYGGCLDDFVKRRNLKQRLLMLPDRSPQVSEAEPACGELYTAL
jgi:hypothetical protein